MVKNAKKELDKIEEFVNAPKSNKKKIIKVAPEMIKVVKAEPEKILSLEFKGYTTEATKYRINWIGVFRKIQRFANGLIIVKISKSDIKVNCEKYWNEYCAWWKQFEEDVNEYGFKRKIRSYWYRYCNWWNFHFNKEE